MRGTACPSLMAGNSRREGKLERFEMGRVVRAVGVMLMGAGPGCLWVSHAERWDKAGMSGRTVCVCCCTPHGAHIACEGSVIRRVPRSWRQLQEV